jgi:hypothetical protein
MPLSCSRRHWGFSRRKGSYRNTYKYCDIYFLFFKNKRNDKKEEVHAKEQEIRNKEIRAKTEEEEYIETLKEIVNKTKERLVFDHSTTIELLKERCNPKYFLSDNDKTIVATEIYSNLLSLGSQYDKLQVRRLIKRANEELGIKLPSEQAYLIMERVFNPLNCVDENFDKYYLLACNKAHLYIENNKEDLRKLEQFAYGIGFLEI